MFKSTKQVYLNRVDEENKKLSKKEKSLIEEEDIDYLPMPLKKYLIKVGVIGKPRISHFKLIFEGEMRKDKSGNWNKIKAEQYTYIKTGVRLFYMTMYMTPLKIYGLHAYDSFDASMVIKIADLIKVANNRGKTMHIAETVTYFNDLCVFAPSALLEESITWEEIDELSVKGTLTKHGRTVSAVLYFNEDGMLKNFISDDRYSAENGSYKKMAWSTPIHSYTTCNGYTLMNEGEAIWHYDKAPLSYIRLNLKSAEINP